MRALPVCGHAGPSLQRVRLQRTVEEDEPERPLEYLHRAQVRDLATMLYVFQLAGAMNALGVPGVEPCKATMIHKSTACQGTTLAQPMARMRCARCNHLVHKHHKYEGNDIFGQYRLHTTPLTLMTLTEKDLAYQTAFILRRIAGEDAKVTDAMAGAGGNTIAFIDTFRFTNAIELQNSVFRMLQGNVRMVFRGAGASKGTDCSHRYKLYNGNALSVVPSLEQDIVFLDPPWGGKHYSHRFDGVSLFVDKEPLGDFCRNRIHKETKWLAIKAPRNFLMNSLDHRFRQVFRNKLICPMGLNHVGEPEFLLLVYERRKV